MKTDNSILENARYRLNLIIIALFCSTTLAPCVLFFFTGKGESIWLIIFIIVSYLFSLIPKHFYDKWQLSSNLKMYHILKVHVFKRFATNGDITNKILRRKFPLHRNVKNYASLVGKLEETYTVEKAHSVLFIFCLLTSIYAFHVGAVGTGGLLFWGNIVFNLYPNFLQQYNRIRYKKVIKQFQKTN